jgi:hypothetical protein
VGSGGKLTKMPSAFDDLFINEAFLLPFGVTLIYSRQTGSGMEVEIEDCLESVISYDRQMEYGASLLLDAREFQIKKEALADDFGEPEKGDLIAYDDKIYEVANIGGAPYYETDADKNWFRIRTVLVEDDA